MGRFGFMLGLLGHPAPHSRNALAARLQASAATRSAGSVHLPDARFDPLADAASLSGFASSSGSGFGGSGIPACGSFCSGSWPEVPVPAAARSMTLCASDPVSWWSRLAGAARAGLCRSLPGAVVRSPARLPGHRPRIPATSRLGSRARGVRVPARSRAGRVPGGPPGRPGAWPRGPGPTHPGRPGRRSARLPAGLSSAAAARESLASCISRSAAACSACRPSPAACLRW